MDPVDKDLEAAEIDASPSQFRSYSTPSHKRNLSKTETGEPIERLPTNSSTSSSSSSEDGATAEERMERAPTQRDVLPALERNETAMSRIHTQRTQHSTTVGATIRSRKTTRPLPPMGANKPFPPDLPEREEYVVEFDGEHDPLHAQNWSLKRKLITATMLAYTTFVSTFGSSIFSAAIPAVARQFGVGREEGTLGTSFYVLGKSAQ